jgi:hypothetical protein
LHPSPTQSGSTMRSVPHPSPPSRLLIAATPGAFENQPRHLIECRRSNNRRAGRPPAPPVQWGGMFVAPPEWGASDADSWKSNRDATNVGTVAVLPGRVANDLHRRDPGRPALRNEAVVDAEGRSSFRSCRTCALVLFGPVPLDVYTCGTHPLSTGVRGGFPGHLTGPPREREFTATHIATPQPEKDHT